MMSRLNVEFTEKLDTISAKLVGELTEAEMGRVAFLLTTNHQRIELDMSEIDEISPDGVASAIEFIRTRLVNNNHVHLSGVPQMLAHTLYKLGWLQRYPELLLLSVQSEQPYGG